MNLNHITIPALDVEASVAFYKLLGLKLIVDALPRYVRFELPKGDASFSIHKVEKIEQPDGMYFYFEVENLKETYKTLKELGISLDTEIIEQPWLWNEIYLKDPSGLKLIIYHAGKNRKNPPWHINKD